MKLLNELLEELPESWNARCSRTLPGRERREDSYARLAFLGDSVLGLAITTHLYPRLEAERFGAGRLTKIRAQAVSGSELPRGRRAPGRARAAARRRAFQRGGRRGGAGGDRARARLGDRGGDRRVLPDTPATSAPPKRSWRRLRRRSSRRWSTRSTSSPRCRSCSPGAARSSLRGHRGDGTAARAHLRGGGAVDGETVGAGSGKSKKHAEQEAAREAVEQIADADMRARACD